MRWLLVVVVAALFVGPLWATGELTVGAFVEPISHLDWDEGQHIAGTPEAPPGPGHGVENGLSQFLSIVAFPVVLVGLLFWMAHVSRNYSDN